MENKNHTFPKDTFSDFILGLVKEKCLFEHSKAKSELFLKETLGENLDGYFFDTLDHIENRIRDIEGISN